MAKKFRVGHSVAWQGEAGHGVGKIIQVHTRDVECNGRTYHASEDDPQYEIQCDKDTHRVLQKGAALKRANDLDRLRQQRFDTSQ